MASSEDSSRNHGAPAPQAVDPTALTVEQLAKMLQIPPEKVRDHVAAGAPTDAVGRINLVHYAAWLNREIAGTDGD